MIEAAVTLWLTGRGPVRRLVLLLSLFSLFLFMIPPAAGGGYWAVLLAAPVFLIPSVSTASVASASPWKNYSSNWSAATGWWRFLKCVSSYSLP